jgi:hypothetical protein
LASISRVTGVKSLVCAHAIVVKAPSSTAAAHEDRLKHEDPLNMKASLLFLWPRVCDVRRVMEIEDLGIEDLGIEDQTEG